MADFRTLNLPALNSATKYPSILTYHQLDPANGNLLDTPTGFTGTVHLSEKIDGVNSRIITFPDGDYVIGSREELLHAKGDRVPNAALGVVDALRDLAARLTPPTSGIRVHFLEVYGGRTTGASKQYTGERAVSYRLFDVAEVPDDHLTWDPAALSTWRENGGQNFLPDAELHRAAELDAIALTPRLASINAEQLPTGLQDTYAFLTDLLPTTRAALDQHAAGRPEGIVLRDSTRSTIAKARLQDYERTFKRRPKP